MCVLRAGSGTEAHGGQCLSLLLLIQGRSAKPSAFLLGVLGTFSLPVAEAAKRGRRAPLDLSQTVSDLTLRRYTREMENLDAWLRGQGLVSFAGLSEGT